jgi:hypothetical protein
VYCNEQWQRFGVAIGFAGLITIISFATHSSEWPLIDVAWMAISVFYISLCGMSFVDLIQAFPKLHTIVNKGAALTARIALGSATFRYLRQ